MTVTEARERGAIKAKGRGTPCHFGGTACHAHASLLILLHKSFQGNFLRIFRDTPPQHADLVVKNINQGREAALLRQVWSFLREWGMGCHVRIPLVLSPAGAGGCLLTVLLALPAAADGWKSGSSFDMRPIERREASAGSSFSGIIVASSFDDPRGGLGSAPKDGVFRLPAGRDPLVKLQALIQHAESRRAGYDAWHESAAVPPPKAPSRMTLAEIQGWIAATPGQHHAIGRYQIVPDTLEGLIRRAGLPVETLFDAQVQDALANILILDAGYAEFEAGRITPGRFMDNLARVWAGFPLASGLSAYDGVAGNKATVTRAFFTAQMAEIFPQQAAQGELLLSEAGGS